MANYSALLKRLEKLESSSVSNIVVFEMADKTIRKMRSKRVIRVCSEAILGSRSQEVATILESVSNNASHQLVELLKMCIESRCSGKSVLPNPIFRFA